MRWTAMHANPTKTCASFAWKLAVCMKGSVWHANLSKTRAEGWPPLKIMRGFVTARIRTERTSPARPQEGVVIKLAARRRACLACRFLSAPVSPFAPAACLSEVHKRRSHVEGAFSDAFQLARCACACRRRDFVVHFDSSRPARPSMLVRPAHFLT